MENRRFEDAYRDLRRYQEGPVPPPHALWRLGRWLLEKSRPKQAKLALQIFVDHYPGHEDRREVMLDLALALKATGQTAEAAALVEAAKGLAGKQPVQS
jgi:hypothetical protein